MNLYDRTTEDSLSELAKAGCLVDLSVNGYGDGAKFRVKIKRNSGSYGTGFEISAEGDGADGAAALRGAVATAETFLHTVPIRPAPKADPFRIVTLDPPLGGRIPAEIDPVEIRREVNRDLAEQHDSKARELVAVDEEIAF